MRCSGFTTRIRVVEIRKAVISGFANRKSERAGNRLFEIARGSDNIELRKAAISSISRRGGDKAVEFLLSLYDTEKNEELKDQITQLARLRQRYFLQFLRKRNSRSPL